MMARWMHPRITTLPKRQSADHRSRNSTNWPINYLKCKRDSRSIQREQRRFPWLQAVIQF